MKRKITTKVTSSNKRERRITITQYRDGEPYAKYRTFKLSKEDFEYYTHYATENDIDNYLRYNMYYVLI